MDGKEAVTHPLGGITERDIGSLRWVHFPTTFNHALRDYAILVRMLPLAPQETLVTAKFLVHRDAQEGRDYTIPHLTETWSRTNDQDRILVERNQQGSTRWATFPAPIPRTPRLASSISSNGTPTRWSGSSRGA